MASANSLVVNLTAKTSAFEKGLNKARRQLRRFAQSARKIVSSIGRSVLNPRSILGGGLLGGVGVYAIKRMADARMVQVQAEKKLAAVLKATGNAAGFSAEELTKYAAELQKVTNFGDEVTISNMGVLASFKNIQGQVFKDTIRAAQDMSSVMGQDLQSSIVQLGKAINDPVKGISALTRVGVTFTDKQKEMIAALQSAGDLMGAQRIVLNELKSEFGGAAEAMLNPFEQLANAFGDLQESIGKIAISLLKSVLPSVQQAIERVSQLADRFADLPHKFEFARDLIVASFDLMTAQIEKLFDDMVRSVMSKLNKLGESVAMAGIVTPEARAIALALRGRRKQQPAAAGNQDVGNAMARLEAVIARLAPRPAMAAQPPGKPAAPGFDHRRMLELAAGVLGKPEKGVLSMLDKIKINANVVSWGFRGILDRAKIRGGAFMNMLENWFGSGVEAETPQRRENRTAAAMERGSAEAYSAIVQAMLGSTDPTVGAIQKMQAAVVGQLKKNAEKAGPKVEIVGNLQGAG